MSGVKPSEWSAATITALHARLQPQACIIVETTDDPKGNGAALIAAYTAAKALTPNGAALLATNRACVIIPPGKYDLDHGVDDACVPLELDTEFVDIIGLTTDRSLQHIYGTPEATNSGVIVQTANDVHISNLTVEILTEVAEANFDDSDSAAYFPSTNLTSVVIDNCHFVGATENTGLLWSTRLGTLEYSGTFNNCIVYLGSFGYNGGTASGTFTNCTGGDYSFGSSGTASGTFTNCTGGNSAFGGGGTASGTFTNCIGGRNSFSGTASGTFTNCTGGDYSFTDIVSGTFTNCTVGNYSFTGVVSGTFTNCTGGDYSFGCSSEASGTFTNCTGGDYSFGGDEGTASGTFTNCTGGNYAFGSYGTASGTFTNCTGGDLSFGGDEGTASGTFIFCKQPTAFETLKCSAATVTIAGGGTSYEVGDELTVVGGTGTAAILYVSSVNAGVIDGIEIMYAGAYTALPSNPVATTGHTGDATFNISWHEGTIRACVDSTGFIAEKNFDDPA